MEGTIEKQIKSLYPKLYQFSHCLLPDDLQNQQLVIDCIDSFLADEISNDFGLLSLIKNSKDDEEKQQLIKTMEFEIFNRVFKLGKTRLLQMENSISLDEVSDRFRPFFKLNVDERAIVFLNYQGDFSIDQICEITKMDKSNVIAVLNIAREELLKGSPDLKEERLRPLWTN